MDANPWRDATKADVELGNVAFLTPCPSKRRRTVAEAPTQQARPTWAANSAEGARKDLGAFEKKMVCRLYYILEKMISEEGGPLAKNQDWYDAIPEGPLRKIASELCGVGRAAVRKYLKEHREGGGVLRSALPRGPVKKGPREVALKSKMPECETLYDCIVGRISSVRRSGRVNTARNLIRYLTVDADGPKLHGVSVRVFRRKLQQMGFFREDKEGANRREVEAVYK